MSEVPAPTPLLAVERLTLDYPAPAGGPPLRVLDGVGFELAAGGSLGLIGESGSGKSQLALALLGLLPTTARLGGSLRFEGEALPPQGARAWQRLRGARIGLVFQDPMSSLTPHVRVGRQLAETLQWHRGASRAAALAEAGRMLDAVRLADPARCLAAYPHELSGGQRQRVMIAMMLLAQPRLLIADEPTTALDATVQAAILALLAQLRRELGLALLFVSHDLGVVAEVAERVLVLYGGRVLETGPAAAVLAAPWQPYTRGLAACRPRVDFAAGAAVELPRPLPGAPPTPAAARPGCRFAPRCARLLPQCSDLDPPWQQRPIEARARACHLPPGE